jgi:3-deoxy-manno-octulosonate cytidylyltransferase (CMP-KDO synthetase)
MTSKNVIVLIPTRLASQRFPNKPLVKIDGKTIIEHCYEWASAAGYPTYVTSGGEEILDLFPNHCIRTHGEFNNGTERCRKALKGSFTGTSHEVVINVQGDIRSGNPEGLRALAGAIRSRKVDMATIIHSTSIKEYHDPNTVKAAITRKGDVLFFTRKPILSITEVRSHVGVYAMTKTGLSAYCALGPCPWEMAESLEQMRWLYHGYRIGAYIDKYSYHSINVLEDISKGEV